jgi:hypothetical protein
MAWLDARLWPAVAAFLLLLPVLVRAQAQPTVYDGHLWIPYTDDSGTQWFMDDRRPALYTQTFGDCQGDSLLNVSRFDAAYYKDNMTVLFHLEGSSALANESVIRESPLVPILVYALALMYVYSLYRCLCLRRV